MSPSENVRILVTGGLGQLGSELKDVAAGYPQMTITPIDVQDLDLTSESSVRDYFATRKFDVIVNCAAYTAVDLAEDNRDIAFRVNSEAVRILAGIAREKRMRMIHISTDYVFDGEANRPIAEEEKPSPLSVYGESKLEGERNLLATLPDAYIIRTAWVYSTYGKNFVKTIRTLADQRSELNIIADQIGSPTYARDLAAAILRIVESITSGVRDEPGIYHFSNEGAISWYDFAYFIVRHGGYACKVNPIRTEEYKTRAVRPRFSLLDKRKIRTVFGITPRHWHESLEECLDRMKVITS